jgi:predicted Zn finger-like uncharacterized protein
MLTQCPNCHARAKLPDDQAGAKVRCAECGRVFVARADEGPAKARAARLGLVGLVGLVLGGLLGILALVALIVSLQSESPNVSAADTQKNAPTADE